MNNLNLIKELQRQVSVGYSDAHTEGLLNIAFAAIAAKESPQEQHSQLLVLVESISKLTLPTMSSFLGGSTNALNSVGEFIHCNKCLTLRSSGITPQPMIESF